MEKTNSNNISLFDDLSDLDLLKLTRFQTFLYKIIHLALEGYYIDLSCRIEGKGALYGQGKEGIFSFHFYILLGKPGEGGRPQPCSGTRCKNQNIVNHIL